MGNLLSLWKKKPTLIIVVLMIALLTNCFIIAVSSVAIMIFLKFNLSPSLKPKTQVSLASPITFPKNLKTDYLQVVLVSIFGSFHSSRKIL